MSSDNSEEGMEAITRSSQEQDLDNPQHDPTKTDAIKESTMEMPSLSYFQETRFATTEMLKVWFPQVDPNHKRAKTFRTKKSRRKVTLLVALSTCIFVMVLNTIVAIVSWFRYDLSPDGIATLYKGNCDTTKYLNTSIHILINILSSLLLGASNISMQLLVAPTRDEVDKAHRKGKWLDIGVLSFRNLRSLPFWPQIVCVILALSSLPIHFLYNSTVFSTVSTNGYVWGMVTEAFIRSETTETWRPLINGTLAKAPHYYQMYQRHFGFWEHASNGGLVGAFNTNLTATVPPNDVVWVKESWGILPLLRQKYLDDPSTFDNISNRDCLQRYSKDFTWRPHVLMISDNVDYSIKLNSSILMWEDTFEESERVFSTQVLPPRLRSFFWTNDPYTSSILSTITPEVAESWASVGNRIQYCLVYRETPGEEDVKACRVQISPSLLLVVSFFNLLKCISIVWIIRYRNCKTMCILGDAIASFLEDTDLTTQHLGILTRADVINMHGKILEVESLITWKRHRLTWFQAASRTRWFWTSFSSLLILIAGLDCISMGFGTVRQYSGTAWSDITRLGFGAPAPEALLDWRQPIRGALGVFANILIVNLWQCAVALAYVSHNALVSCVLVAREWTNYAYDRKTLRMSHPIGIQRSSYYVSMPLSYGLPMLAIFSFEHWALSQTMFVIRIVRIRTGIASKFEASEGAGLTTAGFSLIPGIIAVVVPAAYLLAILLYTNLRASERLGAMPLASTCSLAISANCHRPQKDKEAHLLPVQWGVTGENWNGKKRCAFTTFRDVREPLEGEEFLGSIVSRKVKLGPVEYVKMIWQVARMWLKKGHKKTRHE